jgi:hypothetical protein
MENLGIFYYHLVYFAAIGNILWTFGIFCGHLVYFPRLGILYQEKSGNLDTWQTTEAAARDAKRSAKVFMLPASSDDSDLGTRGFYSNNRSGLPDFSLVQAYRKGKNRSNDHEIYQIAIKIPNRCKTKWT